MAEHLGIGMRLVLRLVGSKFPKVPRMSTDQLQALMRRSATAAEQKQKPLILLDTREKEELQISRLANSIHVDPNLTDMSKVISVIKEQVASPGSQRR